MMTTMLGCLAGACACACGTPARPDSPAMSAPAARRRARRPAHFIAAPRRVEALERCSCGTPVDNQQCLGLPPQIDRVCAPAMPGNVTGPWMMETRHPNEAQPDSAAQSSAPARGRYHRKDGLECARSADFLRSQNTRWQSVPVTSPVGPWPLIRKLTCSPCNVPCTALTPLPSGWNTTPDPARQPGLSHVLPTKVPL